MNAEARFRPQRRERRELFNVNLPRSMWEELTAAAEECGLSRNEFVEAALRFALDRLEKPGKRECGK